MRETTTKNDIEFILDGNAFFEQLHLYLTLVEQRGDPDHDDEPCYVRMAYWQFDGNTTLPALTNENLVDNQAERTLNAAIQAIADKNIPVSIIVWAGEPTTMLVKEQQTNWALWRLFRNNANVRVYRESYKGYLRNPAMSQHQKICVVTVKGLSFALVGGLNLQDHYKSAVVHDAQTHDGHAVNRWHDTAIILKGPAVNSVEREWLRRWNKDENARCERHPKQDQVAPKEEDDPGVHITIATTNDESQVPQTDIRDILVEQIGGAQSYVYLENYALTDPVVVAALAAKIAQKPEMPVITVVSHPEIGFEQDFTAFSYLMYFTYLNLSLSNFNTFQAKGRLQNYTVRYQDITRFGFQPLIYSLSYLSSYYWTSRGQATRTYGKYVMERPDLLADAVRRVSASRIVSAQQTRQFQYATPGLLWGENGNWVRQRDIVAVDAPAYMYAPVVNGHNSTWPYVHSKLALIDDEVAFVGTSNWTFRSMQYDGEISVIVQNGDAVRAIREQLFGHWHQPTDPSNWRAEAEANLRLTNRAQLQDGRPYIVPLRLSNFHWWTFGAWGSWMAPTYF
ncbi:MAG: phospholipase D-like domain-containing protein [Gammaproteobacteria bacterium]|nr:phospholipase D-like domain-containing protein [Gammaproteobacteria bacterium]